MQQGLSVLLQQMIDFRQIVFSCTDSRDQDGIPGETRIQRRHAVYLQCPLCLLKGKPGSQAQFEDRISLPRVLFSGNQLIAIALRDVCPEEDLLQTKLFARRASADVIAEGIGLRQDFTSVFPKVFLNFGRVPANMYE